MEVTLYSYPKCSTCQNAKKWLEQQGHHINEIHIVEAPPTSEELKKLFVTSGLPLKKFFNTSGQKYRELGLKEKVDSASEEELLTILASDGMLIKRPIVTNGEKVTLGFKEDEFVRTWGA